MSEQKRYEVLEGGVDREAFEKIRAAIQSIRYGSVEVVIQDGRVIQIERKEKIRFTPCNKK